VIARELQSFDPTLQFNARQTMVLEDFVLRTNFGLRIARNFATALVGMFLIALIPSFFGLVWSSTSPTSPIDTSAAWLFSTYALLITPTIAIMYEWSLRWFEGLMIKAIYRDKDFAKSLAPFFKISLDVEQTLDDIQPVLQQIEKDKLESYRTEFRKAVAEIKAKAARMFHLS
jgi:hypothetical protein